MNVDLVIETLVEIIVAARAAWYIKTYGRDWKKYIAAVALALGVIGSSVDILRVVLPLNIPEFHLTEEIVAYVVIFLLLSKPTYWEAKKAMERISEAAERLEKLNAH